MTKAIEPEEVVFGVSRLLACSSAVGRYAVNRTMKNSAGQRVPRPEEEWGHIPCERLIDDDTWNAVQQILEEQSTRAVARSGSHPFAGLVHCICGGRMQLPTGTPRLVCDDCKNKIPIDNIQAAFFDQLDGFISSRSSQLFAMLVPETIDSKANAEILQLKQELEGLVRQRTKVEKLLLDDTITAERFGELNNPIEESVRALERRIKSLERKRKNGESGGDGENQLQSKKEVPRKSVKTRKKPEKSRERSGGISSLETEIPSASELWPKFNLSERRNLVGALVDKFIVHSSADLEIEIYLKIDIDSFRNLNSSHKSPQEHQTNQRTKSPTNRPKTVAGGDPTYVRLPKAGERCPHSGMSRSMLNNLILPSKENNYNPPVRSKSVVRPGKTRGTRLIDLDSLKAYVEQGGDA